MKPVSNFRLLIFNLCVEKALVIWISCSFVHVAQSKNNSLSVGLKEVSESIRLCLPIVKSHKGLDKNSGQGSVELVLGLVARQNPENSLAVINMVLSKTDRY